MLKWFSIAGINKEIKRIRWPKAKELGNATKEVLFICILFAIFFVCAEFIITLGLKMIGIGA